MICLRLILCEGKGMKDKKDKKDKMNKKDKKDKYKDKEYKSKADEETKVSEKQSVDKKSEKKEVYENNKTPNKNRSKSPQKSTKIELKNSPKRAADKDLPFPKEGRDTKSVSKLPGHQDLNFRPPKIKPAAKPVPEKVLTREQFMAKMRDKCQGYTSEGYFSHEYQEEVAWKVADRIRRGSLCVKDFNPSKFSESLSKLKEEQIAQEVAHLQNSLRLEKPHFIKEKGFNSYSQIFDTKDSRNFESLPNSQSQNVNMKDIDAYNPMRTSTDPQSDSNKTFEEIKKDKRIRERMVQKIRQYEQNKIQQLLEKDRESQALLKDQKLKERKEYLMQIADQRHSRHKKNKELLKTGNQRLKKIMETIPLHKKLEEEYSHLHSLSTKTIYPKEAVDMEELDRHSRNYKHIKEALLQKKIMDRKHEIQMKFCENRRAKSRVYKSKHLQDIINENLKFKEKFKLKEELAKLRKNRIKNYDHNVRECYRPVISKDKQDEVKSRIELLNRSHHNKSHNEYSTNHSRKSPLIQENSEDENKLIKRSGSLSSANKKYKRKKFKPNPMVPPPKVKKEPIELKYLENKRRKKGPTGDRDSQDYKPYKPYQWDSEIKDKKGLEKFDFVLDKSHQISANEDMQEKYLRHAD
ncbi:unnamed protein product [Moneuplotes crassus]|uniref:Uncharacterized protein n=1 Tax=Euplotes crassus TaxID=5936 RepID=A0AAD1Y7U2_EUPCR|nr:unnamed protein product [Moneuplotes crassus]